MPDGVILKDAAAVMAGDLISTRFHEGEVLSRVERHDAADT
jgi:hypothetical protein